ncbi:uncharacterized protein LOC114243672 [Bombyx mandarina]|uniref:Uncharacterized protein LOC114243672 n=1 Tax=Bombyx mandarina TaxID=7092 RepID=A0A6J2JPX2_BOMMA|nr:uncharacterized protein LOC114243672 [Bombyx mandarina]
MFRCCSVEDLLYLLILFVSLTKGESFSDDAFDLLDGDLDLWHERGSRVAIREDAPTCERQSFYICEEPLNGVPPEAHKTCNYRNVDYHEQVFRWVAGRGCIIYTPSFLFVGGANAMNTSQCFYRNYRVRCLEIPKEDGTCGCYPFDPSFAEVANIIREAIIPSAHGRWERCFYAAQDCCSHYMLEDTNSIDKNECGVTFDGWTCWMTAEAGTVSNAVCSEFAYSNTGPSCNHFSSKECYQNGTWEVESVYTTCSVTPRLVQRYRFHIAMLSISVASCLPAVFIFFFYKRLRITRVALHRNLLIAIILRNTFVIISRNEIYLDELQNTGDTVMTIHGLACRFLAIGERVAGNAVFVCMLVEGIYLHRLIVAVFKQKLNIKSLYAIGAVIAVAPVIAWVAVMAVHNDHSCWLVYTIEHVQWILDVPRVAILLVNTVLFGDILRVLLTKIRNNENSHQLSTTKATLFLMPLFGTQFLLTAFRPNTTDCTGEQIYYYVSYTVEGLQGFIVAILYCYINKEVRSLIKATYKKTESAVVSRIRRDSTHPSMSVDPSSGRRMTYSTGIPSQGDIIKEQYAVVAPKLHVAEIISIQPSERLVEIIEPVYETISNSVNNDSYDALDRSDNDPKGRSKIDDYYNFTNASSITIDCPEWIRCVSSPNSSIYNNSFNDNENKYLASHIPDIPESCNEMKHSKNEQAEKNNLPKHDIGENNEDFEDYDADFETKTSADDSGNMLEEIMQCIENKNDLSIPNLDPERLCPNRNGEDKIIFLNE